MPSPKEPSAAERQAFLDAGNTEAQLAARIRDGVPLNREFGAEDQVLLDPAGHGQAWRTSGSDTWHALSEPTEPRSTTAHLTQGRTVPAEHVQITDESSSGATYVGLTRARAARTDLHAAADAVEAVAVEELADVDEDGWA